MNTYQVYTNHYYRIDADRLHRLVDLSTSRWSSVYGETRFDELKYYLTEDTRAAALSPQGLPKVLGPLTDDVLKAIRSVALSYRYDIRSDSWRLENVAHLINDVDEALEALKAEGKSSAHLAFEFGFHHCR